MEYNVVFYVGVNSLDNYGLESKENWLCEKAEARAGGDQ